MNKFYTNDVGGLPIVLDDLRFTDDSIRNALKFTFLHLGRSAHEDGIFICPTVSGDFAATLPESAVVIEGEIWLIESQALPTPTAGKVLNIRKSTTFTGTTPGLKVFESGSSFDTYQIRVGEIVQETEVNPVPADRVRIATYNGGNWGVYQDSTYYKLMRDYLGITANETTATTNAAGIVSINSQIDGFGITEDRGAAGQLKFFDRSTVGVKTFSKFVGEYQAIANPTTKIYIAKKTELPTGNEIKKGRYDLYLTIDGAVGALENVAASGSFDDQNQENTHGDFWVGIEADGEIYVRHDGTTEDIYIAGIVNLICGGE